MNNKSGDRSARVFNSGRQNGSPTIPCLSGAVLERPVRERYSTKVTTLLLFRCGAWLRSLRFYGHEEINNNISSSFVLYTWRCRTRRGSARAGYHGPTKPESTLVL